MAINIKIQDFKKDNHFFEDNQVVFKDLTVGPSTFMVVLVINATTKQENTKMKQ